jgi:hypothetical protein
MRTNILVQIVGNKMSIFVNVKSVCGKASASVDVYDLDANPHGVICCDSCESILICRKAWDFLYKGIK